MRKTTGNCQYEEYFGRLETDRHREIIRKKRECGDDEC